MSDLRMNESALNESVSNMSQIHKLFVWIGLITDSLTEAGVIFKMNLSMNKCYLFI